MFGIAEDIRSEVRVCTSGLLRQALDAPQVAKTCAEIEDALEACRCGKLSRDEYETLKGQLKKRLPILTPHATFRDGHRKNSEAIPSGLCIYDLDHIPDPRAKWAEIEPRKTELGILLAHITPSTEGLRLVFRIQAGTDLAQSQAWMARQLGDKLYDACVKDYARCSFLVPREYVLWMDEEGLFAPYSPQSAQSPADEILPADGIQDENNENNLCESVKSVVNKETYPPTYEEIPYTTIVQTLEEQMGGQPEHGSRNNFIFSMACHLRYVCDDDPAWIAQVLPTYGEAREKWMATIRSACTRSQTRTLPRIMRRTLAICKQRMEEAETIHRKSEADAPPAMPRRLPPLIKLLVSRTPRTLQPVVAQAVFPPLAAHLWRTRFKYVDNTPHEATLSNILMAPTGSGKSCINTPIDYIMADIRQRDRANMERERNWKRECNSKGANKDKRERPEGIVIQEIDPDSTSAAFVQRMADADGRFLYARMNEIEMLNNLSSRGRQGGPFELLCLAFDYGNVYGQTRVGAGSVNERVTVRFNFNASTTVRKGQHYFRRVLTDGPISRISFSTLPERPIGSEMPVYGTYDAAFAEELKPYIERLNNARGLIESRQVNTLSKKLVAECAEFARLSQSRVYENLSFRANVIAFLKAMVLYVAHGGQWDKSMDEFVRWSLKYDLWVKLHLFGEAIERQEQQDAAGARKRGPQNLLDLLPETFTREEAQQMRQRMGIVHGTLTQMLANWKHRGYIRPGEGEQPKDPARQRFTKTGEYLKKYAKPLTEASATYVQPTTDN